MKKTTSPAIGQPPALQPIPANLTEKEAVLDYLLQIANHFGMIYTLPDIDGAAYLAAEMGENMTMLFYQKLIGEA